MRTVKAAWFHLFPFRTQKLSMPTFRSVLHLRAGEPESCPPFFFKKYIKRCFASSSMDYLRKISSSYRRRLLDKMLEEHQHIYKGIVLDIGGRDRGTFKKPKGQVKQWLFADIVKTHNPDIILDVTDMKAIKTDSIDVINATELFEHVRNPEQGLDECHRALKKGGTIIMSMPFLYPLHADPYDYQRWTSYKWHEELKKRKFKKIVIVPMGGFFTVMSDHAHSFFKTRTRLLRYACYVFYPFMSLINHLDNTAIVQKNRILSGYTTGYFITAKK